MKDASKYREFLDKLEFTKRYADFHYLGLHNRKMIEEPFDDINRLLSSVKRATVRVDKDMEEENRVVLEENEKRIHTRFLEMKNDGIHRGFYVEYPEGNKAVLHHSVSFTQDENEPREIVMYVNKRGDNIHYYIASESFLYKKGTLQLNKEPEDEIEKLMHFIGKKMDEKGVEKFVLKSFKERVRKKNPMVKMLLSQYWEEGKQLTKERKKGDNTSVTSLKHIIRYAKGSYEDHEEIGKFLRALERSLLPHVEKGYLPLREMVEEVLKEV